MQKSRYIKIDNIRTHYLEAGDGFPVILLHSGEFGGCAELSWEYNIEALASHFHVYAPDMVGFGKTDKIFSFESMIDFRIDHIKKFLDVLCIDQAYFVGSSMGANLLFRVASSEHPAWPIRKLIAVGGGGAVLDNQARKIMNSYDMSFEHMKKIHEICFFHQRWVDDRYVEKRYRASLIPGAWECTAAARFRGPKTTISKDSAVIDYHQVRVPVLLVSGGRDPLKPPGWEKELAGQIPGARYHVFEEASHFAHIECHEEFNRIAVEFLSE